MDTPKNASNTLADNPVIQELFATLKENNQDPAGFTALLGYVKQMEDFVTTAEAQIADMQANLNEIREIQKHPVKNAVENTTVALEHKVTGIRASLNRIRSDIIEACSNMLTAIKSKGITALDTAATFLGIKKSCEKIQQACTAATMDCNKSITKIDKFSQEYHQTGLHLKNMLRVAVGKEALETPKENGQIAKAMCAPYKAQRKCMDSISQTATKAIDKLDALWITADDIRKDKQTPQERMPVADQLATYEAKAKEVNTKNAKDVTDKPSNVIDFKKKADDMVMA